MPAFDDHQAALNRAVFDQFAQPAKLSGCLAPINVVLNRGTADFEGVTYDTHSAQIYLADASNVIGKTLTAGCDKWEIGAVIERDEQTQTYALKAL